MWLTKKMRGKNAGERPKTGIVQTGGAQTRVLGEQEYICTANVFPYGVYAMVSREARAVVLDGLCLGVTDRVEGLEEGEICLYSRGGASIVLKNSGEVLINGQSFQKEA